MSQLKLVVSIHSSLKVCWCGHSGTYLAAWPGKRLLTFCLLHLCCIYSSTYASFTYKIAEILIPSVDNALGFQEMRSLSVSLSEDIVTLS